MLSESQSELIAFCLSQGVLQWGDFTLKSGRKSPYFFNAGCISDGQALRTLGGYYAQYMVDHGLSFDVLFGPAYKGITLASATAMALAEHHGRTMPFAYNRKEAKDHGEGGLFVGPMSGALCVIDDVITSGATVEDVLAMLPKAAHAKHWLVCLDRQEKVGDQYAADHVRQTHGVAVHALLTVRDLIAYLEAHDPQSSALEGLHAHFNSL